MDIISKIASELEVRDAQVKAAVELIDEGCTIPFIARYRKEKTGSLNDEVLRKLYDRLTYLRNLEEKKVSVLGSIEEQGKLTPELKKSIEEAETMVALEDLYRPYKQKKRTRATVAKEAGLEPLANLILLQMTSKPVEEDAESYVDAEKGVEDVNAAIAGASDIIAEFISDDADYRKWIREKTFKDGLLVSEAKDKEAKSVYETYYDFKEPVSKITGYRILAINRGEKEKILTVKVDDPEEDIISYLEGKIIVGNEYTDGILKNAIEDSYKRLIAPSVERDIRNELSEKAEDGAIDVFGKNLTQLLMQPPISGCTVLGWDPAYRQGA